MQATQQTNLLLIEDNPGDARLIKEMLAEQPEGQYHLDWRTDLLSGLAHLAENKVDLVLLDLNLPDSRGFDTFAKVLERAPRIPIVVLTGISDEDMAVKAVKQGAQDYLVKGQADAVHLLRSIRYAIARRAGGDRKFTLGELRAFDGKEDRPAYIAFEEKVYDVTGNRLWKAGAHVKQHFAGQDLTGMLEKSPHGVETLLKIPVLGELVKERSLFAKALFAFEAHHPHSLVVHFSVAYGIGIPLFAILYVFAGGIGFEAASYYLLLLGLLFAPLSGLSGVLSWKTTYEGKQDRLYTWKIVLTSAFSAVTIATSLWRTLDDQVLVDTNFFYIGLLLSLAILSSALGYIGGKISHP